MWRSSNERVEAPCPIHPLFLPSSHLAPCTKTSYTNYLGNTMDVDEDVDYGHDDELRPDEELEDVVSLGSGADDEQDLLAYRAHHSPTELTIPPSSIPATQQNSQDSHVHKGIVPHVALPSSIERVSSIATSTDSIPGSQDATTSTRLSVESSQPTQLTHELPSKPNFAPKYDKHRDTDRDRSNRSSVGDLRGEYKRGGELTEDDRHYTGTAARRGRDRSPRSGSDRAPRSSETLGNNRVSTSDSHRRAPSERSARPFQDDKTESTGSERKRLASQESEDRRFVPNPAYNRARSASPPRDKPLVRPAGNVLRDAWRAAQGVGHEPRDSRTYPSRDMTDRVADSWRPTELRPPRVEQERTAVDHLRTTQSTRPERRNEDKPPAQEWQRHAQRTLPIPHQISSSRCLCGLSYVASCALLSFLRLLHRPILIFNPLFCDLFAYYRTTPFAASLEYSEWRPWICASCTCRVS
jgi:hypothetical protein